VFGWGPDVAATIHHDEYEDFHFAQLHYAGIVLDDRPGCHPASGECWARGTSPWQEVRYASINTLLDDHVVVKYEFVDRIFLNGYVSHLQTCDDLAWFLCQHQGPAPLALRVAGLGNTGWPLRDPRDHLGSAQRFVITASK
jgi:hypothetical protein